MSSQYILIYSDKCSFCKQLLDLLSSSEFQHITNMIKKVKIEDKRFTIPSNIKMVPAVIIKENNQLNSWQGKDVLTWLNLKNNHVKGLIAQRQQEQQQKQPMMNAQNSQMPGEILSYDPFGMGSSWSDSFSNLNDNTPMSHRFNFIDGTNGSIGQNSGIPTPQDMKNEEKLKGDLGKALESYMAERDRGISVGIQRT
jgi:glutaredoxin